MYAGTEPGDEPQSQNLVIYVTIPIILLVIFFVTVVILLAVTIILVKKYKGTRNREPEASYPLLEKKKSEFITANITFQLEDKPHEFLKVLQQLYVSEFMFMNTMHSSIIIIIYFTGF